MNISELSPDQLSLFEKHMERDSQAEGYMAVFRGIIWGLGVTADDSVADAEEEYFPDNPEDDDEVNPFFFTYQLTARLWEEVESVGGSGARWYLRDDGVADIALARDSEKLFEKKLSAVLEIDAINGTITW